MKQIVIIVAGFLLITIMIATSDIIKDSMRDSIKIDGKKIYVERVTTPKDQARGLGGRESLAKDSGMLFVYDAPQIRSFWMKDMLFPIDIIWIDKNKKIVNITKNITSDSFPERISSEASVLYVLEVNSGIVDENNISIGDIVDI